MNCNCTTLLQSTLLLKIPQKKKFNVIFFHTIWTIDYCNGRRNIVFYDVQPLQELYLSQDLYLTSGWIDQWYPRRSVELLTWFCKQKIDGVRLTICISHRTIVVCNGNNHTHVRAFLFHSCQLSFYSYSLQRNFNPSSLLSDFSQCEACDLDYTLGKGCVNKKKRKKKVFSTLQCMLHQDSLGIYLFSNFFCFYSDITYK